MKFEEVYPEFGGDNIIEQSLKYCPSCNAIFNMWKKDKNKLEEYKQKVKEIIAKHTTNLIGHHFSDEPCECAGCKIIQELGLD